MRYDARGTRPNAEPPRLGALRRNRHGALALALAICAIVSLGALAALSSVASARDTVRIVGGTPAAPSAWPWAVYYEIDALAGPYASCGGVLVAPQWVLTAAHCVLENDMVDTEGGPIFPPSDIHLVLGQSHITRTATGAAANTTSVDEDIVDPNYSTTTGANDVALVHLTQPVTNIAPIRIVAPQDSRLWTPETPATVVGWGTTSENGLTSDDLLQVSVPIVDDTTCAATFSGYDPKSMLCAGNVANGGMDACQGDSGGPLMVSDGPGVWRLVGTVSQGNGCGDPGNPGIYARVGASGVSSWIFAIIGASYPIADFTASTFTPGVGQRVVLTSTSTHQPSSVANVSYLWNTSGGLANGQASGATTSAVFTTPGRYVVGLAVTDSNDVSDVVSREFTVGPAPTRVRLTRTSISRGSLLLRGTVAGPSSGVVVVTVTVTRPRRRSIVRSVHFSAGRFSLRVRLPRGARSAAVRVGFSGSASFRASGVGRSLRV